MRKERAQEVVIKNTGRSRHAAELGWSDRGWLAKRTLGKEQETVQ